VNPDFLDMLSAFLEEDVEFLLVGAYALSAHGYPRATGDLDLWINNSRDNAARVWNALNIFQAPLDRIKQSDFCDDDLIFQIGIVPSRIDIMTQIDGVFWGRLEGSSAHRIVRSGNPCNQQTSPYTQQKGNR